MTPFCLYFAGRWRDSCGLPMPSTTTPLSGMHISLAIVYVVSHRILLLPGPERSDVAQGNLLRHAILQHQDCVLPPPEPGRPPMHSTASAYRRAALHQPRKPRSAPNAPVSGPWYCLIHGPGESPCVDSGKSTCLPFRSGSAHALPEATAERTQQQCLERGDFGASGRILGQIDGLRQARGWRVHVPWDFRGQPAPHLQASQHPGMNMYPSTSRPYCVRSFILPVLTASPMTSESSSAPKTYNRARRAG